jgi:hypothetical protein
MPFEDADGEGRTLADGEELDPGEGVAFPLAVGDGVPEGDGVGWAGAPLGSA